VKASSLPHTILRPSGFQSNALRWDLSDGVVRAPWPDVPIAAIDPADIAAVAAVALTDGAAPELELSGPEALRPADQVAILAEVLGRELRYEGEYDDSRVVDTVRALTGRAGSLRGLGPSARRGVRLTPR
jgi:uncharacterized protein YbjT (DUF2867 family)